MENTLTFQTLLQNLDTFQVGAGFSIGNITLSLFISLIIALFIGFIYKKSYQGVLYSKSFTISLVAISLVTSIVIMTISGNLILSLGMVGALSIVRFRTAVKDPVDLAYMFWAITIGIANGVGFYKLSIIGSLFIATVFLLSKTKRHTRSTYVCIIKIKKSDMDSAKKSLSTLLGKYTVRSTQVVDENIELIIQTVKKHNKEIYLTEQLSTCKELTSFQLITYTGDADVTP